MASAEVAAVPANPQYLHTPPESSISKPITPIIPAVTLNDTNNKGPFASIRTLFDHLHTNPSLAESLNAIYPRRGDYKTAATQNTQSDQKFTINLSPDRIARIPSDLRDSLSPNGQGLNEVLSFFDQLLESGTVWDALSTLSVLASVDLSSAHKTRNAGLGYLNFRLCDYNPSTASPSSENGCGAHTDYGTFSIIFQDGSKGPGLLEIEDAESPGVWVPVPGDATVVLAGWCCVVLSGGRIRAARHRVVRQPGRRRLSVVLFVAPDLEVKLKPLEGVEKRVGGFSETIMRAEVSVAEFKEVMGKRWRYREGNGELGLDLDRFVTQDDEIEKLVWGRLVLVIARYLDQLSIG